MKRTFLLLCSILVSLGVFGQQMPKPELYIVHEDIVKPSALMQYEAASKDFISALTEKKFSSPMLNWRAFMTPDMHFVYVGHLDNFASLDTMQTEWGRAREAVGAARWDDTDRRGNEATSSYNDLLVLYRPDLSYIPANPRLSMSDRRYVRWDFYYLLPGHQKEAEAIARDYVALFKQKNIAESFNIYMAVYGNDLPLLVAAIPGRSDADLIAANNGVNTTLGADVRPLQQRALAITRKFERREGTLRPDLGYPPPAPTPTPK
jgi:hypothetical protein